MKHSVFLKPALLLLALIAGVGSSWADNVTWDLTQESYSDASEEQVTWSSDYATMTLAKGSSQTKANNYLPPTYEYTRFYRDQVLTIAPANGYEISSVEFTMVRENHAQSFARRSTWENASATYENSTVNVTPTNGENAIVASISSNIYVNQVVVTYKTAFDPNKPIATLSFPEEQYTADINDGFTAPELNNEQEVAVGYSSSNTAVAEVNTETGAVTLKAIGTTTIKAQFSGNDEYNASDAFYVLKVTDRMANDGSEDKPFTVGEAYNFAQEKRYEEGIFYYIKGVVANTGGNWIDDDGSMSYRITDEEDNGFYLPVQSGKYLNGENFTSTEDLTEGDELIVVGPLKCEGYNVYIDTGNYIHYLLHKTAPLLTLTNDFIEMDVADELNVSELYETNSNGAVTFTSSDPEVANVVDNVLHAYQSGFVTISIDIAATSEYAKAHAEFWVNVKYKEPEVPELTITTPWLDMDATTEQDVSELYTTNSDGEVTFTSDDPEVAEVVDNVLHAYKPGTTTIYINIAETSLYYAASDAFTVNVTTKDPVDPEPLEETYQLVTDASTLAAGDKLLIVGVQGSKYYAMSTQTSGNSRRTTPVTVNDGVISTLPNRTEVIELEGETGAWYLKATGTAGYLYAASSENDELGTEEEADDNAEATIGTDSDGNATILFQGTNTHNQLMFNRNQFSCYEPSSENSNLTLPQLYRSKSGITIGEAGWRTLVAAKDMNVPEGVKAFIVTDNDGATATLTEVSTVKANTPYILKGEAGDYKVTLAESAEEPEGNLLKISDETTGNGAYVLANGTHGPGFYKWTGGSLGAGRVYLTASAGAPAFINVDESTTGISNVNRETDTNGRYYSLQGVEVAQPTKGLYIVNGKKVVIK